MMYRWTMLPFFPGVGGGHLPRYILRPSESLNLIALGPASLLSLLTLPTLLTLLAKQKVGIDCWIPISPFSLSRPHA